jgi:ubiquinol-cytochrome c reductase cytochrome b subunit
MMVLIRQKHSQFPGPGRTDTNVVGSRLWPGYAVRSLGLLAAVFAACLLLGGLVQINPIWLWGPFDPGSAIAPAQPDWYVGWVDGALRLWPPWEPRILGYRLPAVFIPGVLLPGVTFLALYLWPWLERLVTGDRREHQVLERPRDRPARVAIGVGALTFYLLLLAAFADGVISRYTGVPVYTILAVFRVATPLLPFVTGTVAFLLARALRDSEAESFSELTWSDLTSSLWRRRRPEPAPMPAEEVVEHLPVETGPVP